MNDSVKYQLERAEDALRTALKFGAETENTYLLRNITETINTISGWRSNYKFNSTKKVQEDSIKFNTNFCSGAFSLSDSGLDEMPYNYVGSHVKGGAGEDVILFG